MQIYSVEVLHPKAYKLLKNLADLKLIALKNEKKTKPKTTDFQEILLNGPTWSEADYQEYLKNREAINSLGER